MVRIVLTFDRKAMTKNKKQKQTYREWSNIVQEICDGKNDFFSMSERRFVVRENALMNTKTFLICNPLFAVCFTDNFCMFH